MVFSEKIIQRLKLSALFILPLLFYLLPEKSIYEGHSICLFVNLFGVECFGCGMTRAVYSAVHLDFARAMSYNKLVVVVLPLLVYVWVMMIYKIAKGMKA